MKLKGGNLTMVCGIVKNVYFVTPNGAILYV